MATRATVVRKMILPSTVNLETSEKDYSKKEIYCVKRNISNFPKETEEDSSEDSEPPTKKKARCSISNLTRRNFHWYNKPSERTFTRLNSDQSNFSAKGKGAAEHISSPIEAWSLLFSDDLLNIILNCTNQEINPDIDNPLDMIELKAFIGLLYYAGYKKKNCTKIQDCFSAHGLPLFRAASFESRLKFLFAYLLFDDKTTRDKRIKSDCYTHIREIWNLFITNCIQYYEPGYNVTIDEQILKFSGKGPMRLSCKSVNNTRSNRGLKILTMYDSETFYMINAIPYTSNVENESLKSLPFYYVRKISEPIHNTCRNITCNNWFTSVPLVDTMLEKFSLTIVGSLRRNKVNHSLFITKPNKGKYRFDYGDNKTLVSYLTENDKLILLLSSLHYDSEINKVENKPEIVLHYNKTIGASDTFDQLCHEYTVLDQAAVNSFVLYTLNANNQVITRDRFLLELSMVLIKPILIERCIQLSQNPKILIRDKYVIKSFLDEQDLPKEDPSNLRLNISNKLLTRKRVYCNFCSKFFLKRKLTKRKCLKCNIPMCRRHTAKICRKCAENQFFKHLY